MKIRKLQSVLPKGAGALALILSASGAALAADGGAGSAPQTEIAERPILEEIIVQARRQDENIQRVPLTITAVSEDKLSSLGIDDLFELQRAVPGLASYGTSGVFVWLRGLQGIAAYFADAPFTREATGQYFDSGSVQ